MIIKPKVRGFICTNAHPQGCFEHVVEQANYVTAQDKPASTIKNVLILGASTGYGLASRIVSVFGYGANTLGVFFEKPPTETKTASAGFYNTSAIQQLAREKGLYAGGINCDAFAAASKPDVINTIKANMGKIDLVVYSLAAPRRTDPVTGDVYSSVLKPVGDAVTRKTLNTGTGEVHDVTLEPANQDEINHTIKVMGGEDWELWTEALLEADVLADGCKTVAYTYIGKDITKPIYGHATIGKAKEDLDRASKANQRRLNAISGEARVAVLKAVVTQASSAIPVMPLYMSLLFKVMKDKGTHEGCIEQIYQLFTQCMFGDSPVYDEDRRWRVDSLELRDEVQDAVKQLWQQVNTDNLNELSDFSGYQQEFLKLFGFGLDNVDYDADTSPVVEL